MSVVNAAEGLHDTVPADRRWRAPDDAAVCASESRRSDSHDLRSSARSLRRLENAMAASGGSNRSNWRPRTTVCGWLPRCKHKVMIWWLVGCSRLSGLSMQSAWTAGPDGVREQGPIGSAGCSAYVVHWVVLVPGPTGSFHHIALLSQPREADLLS